ncbi:MAG: hypothetical protein H6736_18230 [Alphaproteobacteria bacterium]|nr:hypothetical protein [Alphaproteobacteria bacterium]MCB9693753.1 hypothetical protein [Alphaproteobacteria bacterium]
MLVLLSTALADIVVLPTVECPDGAVAVRGGSASGHCEPRKNDVTCPEGMRMRDVGLCIQREQICTGGLGRRGGCREDVPVVTGTCERGETCAEGDCDVAARCVDIPSPPVEPSEPAEVAEPETRNTTGSALCATAGTPVLTVFMGLLPLALRRRRTC